MAEKTLKVGKRLLHDGIQYEVGQDVEAKLFTKEQLADHLNSGVLIDPAPAKEEKKPKEEKKDDGKADGSPSAKK